MYKSKLSESILSEESESMIPCRTDFKALPAVAVKAARNPAMLNIGSAPLAMIIPTMTGIKDRYTDLLSLWPIITAASNAVNAGVVAPIA
jgi:hypothetical protein